MNPENEREDAISDGQPLRMVGEEGREEGESERGQSRVHCGVQQGLSIITSRFEPHITPRRNKWKLLHLDGLPPRVTDWQGFEKGSGMEPFGRV